MRTEASDVRSDAKPGESERLEIARLAIEALTYSISYGAPETQAESARLLAGLGAQLVSSIT